MKLKLGANQWWTLMTTSYLFVCSFLVAAPSRQLYLLPIAFRSLRPKSPSWTSPLAERHTAKQRPITTDATFTPHPQLRRAKTSGCVRSCASRQTGAETARSPIQGKCRRNAKNGSSPRAGRALHTPARTQVRWSGTNCERTQVPALLGAAADDERPWTTRRWRIIKNVQKAQPTREKKKKNCANKNVALIAWFLLFCYPYSIFYLLTNFLFKQFKLGR